MYIQLGNLSTKDICNRLQITLTEQEIETLENLRSIPAEFKGGKWHGFDIPFSIYCGDIETAVIVRDIYAKYASEMKEQLHVTFMQRQEEEK